ncbi:proline-rich membrane anchor 1 isoform X1 [Clupea harengus]|uniref:Proline-rich membrane anchor 1 isoform X1 n=1 Tax=Clupea harengus TaxID=7950 RepID=A0A8M1KP57_CLUHA|nr:proline-rich membrane anchor 1 isoform X1 [Clupea harengus]
MIVTLHSVYSSCANVLTCSSCLSLSSFWSSLQLALGEPQRSCSRTVSDTVGTRCQLACQCRPYPPLPPPPPPPPPPRIMVPVPPPVEPARKPWWNEMLLVLGTTSCASIVFLLLTAIVCYKSIKRKPLRKEENGTSRGEYAMSSRTKTTTVETNSTGV